jgi:hypothetical protein
MRLSSKAQWRPKSERAARSVGCGARLAPPRRYLLDLDARQAFDDARKVVVHPDCEYWLQHFTDERAGVYGGRLRESLT